MGTWIVVVSSIVGALGAFLVARWVYERNKQKSQRESAIELMKFFVTLYSPHAVEISYLAQLISKLDLESCIAISQGKAFTLAKEHERHLRSFLLSSKRDDLMSIGSLESQSIRIDDECSQFMRIHMNYILNILETVAAAHLNGVGDKEIIIREFTPLLYPGGRPTFETYVKASGIFPSLDQMGRKLRV